MRTREYKHKSYKGCKCELCYNNRVVKDKQISRTRVYIKRDLQREIKEAMVFI